jgi:FecR protein
MNAPERDHDAISSSLGALLQREAEARHELTDRTSRASLLQRAATTQPTRLRVIPAFRVALPALAVAATVLIWWLLPNALRYEVIGAQKDGAYVSAPNNAAASLHFTDDTVVEVAAASQLRVEDTSRRGARVLLERGLAKVHVVHRERTRWTFEAGPFEVLVTGTRFDLSWDPASEVLVLKLHEGSVEIQTPFGAAPVALHAGQDFRADLHERSMTTTDGGVMPAEHASVAPAGASASSGAAPASAVAPEAPSTSANSGPLSLPGSSAALPSSASARPWPKLVAAGQFTALLAQANERGTSNCLRACSASDLSALADAARYTGRTELAGQSLHALRARFAREPEGHSAAFLLGRLREGQGAASDARTWYERYSNEAPGGPYAAEALAGKMRTTLTLEGRAAAEPIAEDYLRRYPTGVQAGTARGIVGSH